jgi:hypothetical protein
MFNKIIRNAFSLKSFSTLQKKKKKKKKKIDNSISYLSDIHVGKIIEFLIQNFTEVNMQMSKETALQYKKMFNMIITA